MRDDEELHTLLVEIMARANRAPSVDLQEKRRRLLNVLSQPVPETPKSANDDSIAVHSPSFK